MVRVVAVKVVRKSKLGCLQIETQIGRPQIETRTSANRKWYTRSSPDGHLERITRWTATSQEEGGSFPAASQERGSFPAASQEEGRELPSSFPRGRARGWQEPQKPRSLVGTKKYNILNKRNKEKAYFRRVKPNLEFGDPTRSRRDHARDHPGPNILPAS